MNNKDHLVRRLTRKTVDYSVPGVKKGGCISWGIYATCIMHVFMNIGLVAGFVWLFKPLKRVIIRIC